MDKNWLIRTKSNHILGPVSRDKVIELYKNGSIKPDDEVCSGNGFWFYIREDDMVNRYLLGSEVQGFNPISEAKDILTATGPVDETPEPPKDDITLVGGLNLSMLKEAPVEEAAPPAPQLEEATPPTPAGPKKKPKTERQVKCSANVSVKRPPLKSQNFLKYAGILGFLLLFGLVYFRKTIIRSLFQGEMTLMSMAIISPAMAQEEVPAKKKSF